LLVEPEPIDVVALVPDDPPRLFRWRQASHRVTRLDGPERLVHEWWTTSAITSPALNSSVRDYYRVETEDGQRYWIYRDNAFNAKPGQPAARWYLHGFCA
jgi:protein ImuB